MESKQITGAPGELKKW